MGWAGKNGGCYVGIFGVNLRQGPENGIPDLSNIKYSFPTESPIERRNKRWFLAQKKTQALIYSTYPVERVA